MNLCVCYLTKSCLFNLLLFMHHLKSTLFDSYLFTPGVVGRRPSDGSHQVSAHTLGHPDKRRQCQGELRRSFVFFSLWPHSSFTPHRISFQKNSSSSPFEICHIQQWVLWMLELSSPQMWRDMICKRLRHCFFFFFNCITRMYLSPCRCGSIDVNSLVLHFARAGLKRFNNSCISSH